MARRAELTIEIITILEAAVLEAHWPQIAARKLGIHRKTYNAWMKVGEDAHLAGEGQSPKDGHVFLCRTLYEKIEEAEAKAEMNLLEEVKTLAATGKTSWNAPAQILERRFPDRWKRRDASTGAFDQTWDQQRQNWASKHLQVVEPKEPGSHHA